MAIAIQEEDVAQVMVLDGRLDALSAKDFDGRADEILARGHKLIIIDLKDLEYISSAGFRSMLMLAKKVKAIDGRLVLCGLDGLVKNVFEVSGFVEIFTIVKDRAEARASLA
jgi:anti-anti-sigma factor